MSQRDGRSRSRAARVADGARGRVDLAASGAPRPPAMAPPWRKEGRERRVRPTGLTLPQAFSDYAAFFAGRLAGLEAMRVLSEPAAAANAYAVDEHLREEGNVVVLHVGGGTAEASVLTLVDGAYDALGLEYDPFFGGQDLERRIVDHFVRLVRNKHGKDISNDGAAMDKLRTARRSRGVRPRAPPAARRRAARQAHPRSG